VLPRDERLLDLLERWYESDQKGATTSIEQLCAAAPELADDLRRQIAVAQRLHRLARADEGGADTAVADGSAPATGSAGPAQPATVPSGLPCIPGYTDLTWIANGGMATVYRARHVRLRRDAALKLVRAERLSATMRARLEAEARAVAQLDHPHIVKVFEVGQCEPVEGAAVVPYIALEYVAGGSLQKRLERQALAPAESAHLVLLLARAIHHAHQKGIVHRDLKPDNVLLAEPADEPALNTAVGCPKLTDFGLARQARTESRVTQEGTVVGTPAYMAPEQADGQAEVGPPADVYALGAILYRLLAGRVPFEADSAIDVLYQVRHQAPVAIRALRPEVPAELEAICLRCLAKRPDQRYPSAAALAEDLRRWLGDWRRAAGPTESVAVKAVPARPGRRRWLLAAGTVAALAVAAAVVGWLARPKPTKPEVPAAPPYKGSIDIVMTRRDDRLRQLVRLDDPASRPLRVGDEVRVVVKMNRPAYLYVLWIDTQGEVGPVYPWIEGDWKRRRAEKPMSELSLPDNRTAGVYKVMPGPAGMETLLLLVRETALPEEEDLAQALAGLGPQQRARAEELREVAWFENGRVVTGEKDRAANLKETAVSSNPVLRLQEVLGQRLGGRFDYTRAVTFGNLGGR
jgi:tRNA A-37 threonylcarbamoyl transferase component Bud32